MKATPIITTVIFISVYTLLAEPHTFNDDVQSDLWLTQSNAIARTLSRITQEYYHVAHEFLMPQLMKEADIIVEAVSECRVFPMSGEDYSTFRDSRLRNSPNRLRILRIIASRWDEEMTRAQLHHNDDDVYLYLRPTRRMFTNPPTPPDAILFKDGTYFL